MSTNTNYVAKSHTYELPAVAPQNDTGIEDFTLYPQHNLPQLCIYMAEPCMGKSYALDKIAQAHSIQGLPLSRLNLLGCSSESALAKLARFSKTTKAIQVADPTQHLVVIDHIPAMDESELARFHRYIQPLLDAHFCITLAIRPEAEALLESFPRALCVYASSLVHERTPNTTGELQQQQVYKLCRGIPFLEQALFSGGFLQPVSHEHMSVGPIYTDALSKLIMLSLRPSLIPEEILLRAAMFMLGSGTFDELSYAVPRADTDIMTSLARDAPIFGINIRAKEFCGAGFIDTDIFAICLRALKGHSDFAQVAFRCCELLAKRQNIKRASLVLELCERNEAFVEFCLLWAPDLLDAGANGIVKLSIEKASTWGWLQKGYLLAAKAAYESVYTKRYNANFMLEDPPSYMNSAEQLQWYKAQLFVAARNMLKNGKVPDVLLDNNYDDSLVERLIAHIRVFRLIEQGKLTLALQVLITCDLPHNAKSAWSHMLLEMDREYTRTLLFDTGDALSSQGQQPSDDLLLGAAGSYNTYHEAALELDEFIHTPAKHFVGESCLAHAGKREDSVVRALFACLCAIGDLRASNYALAYVRTGQALEIAKTHSLGALLNLAHILNCVSRSCSGELITKADIFKYIHEDPLFEPVAQVLVAAIDGSNLELADPHPPRDVLWFLAAIKEGIPHLSKRVAEKLPPSWEACISHYEQMRAPTLHHEEQIATLSSPKESDLHLVELKLLGLFELVIGGKPVPSSKLDRRRMREILNYVASSEGRRATKYELVDNIWPECDYYTGAHRINQSVAELRKVLSQFDPNVDLFIKNRGKAIILNPAVVHSDLDDFELIMRDIAGSKRDDGELIDLAQKADCLFKGDLLLFGSDGTGVLQSRQQYIHTGFVDCMVAGAEAALSQKLYRAAIHFAERASHADGLREDVINVLIRALEASGREGEAQARYKAYMIHLVDVTGSLPVRTDIIKNGSKRKKRHSQLRLESARFDSVNNPLEQISKRS